MGTALALGDLLFPLKVISVLFCTAAVSQLRVKGFPEMNKQDISLNDLLHTYVFPFFCIIYSEDHL